MKLYGVSPDQLRDVVLFVSNRDTDGNLTFNNFTPSRSFVTFTLRVNNSKGKGAKRSGSGRRTVSACWHTHKAVMQEIFNRYPQARIVSALATYNGADDFARKFPETAYHNVGSMFAPCEIASCCEC